MVPNVPLPDLLRKITTDHAGNRLGEFREMITTMLKTFVSEMNVSSGAVNTMHEDVQKMNIARFSLKVRKIIRAGVLCVIIHTIVFTCLLFAFDRCGAERSQICLPQRRSIIQRLL
jgi:hypothetical protein